MATKTEDGVAYPSSAFLVVPDPQKPSDWKLRYKEKSGEKIVVTQAQLGRAAAALSPGGFRGNSVQLSDDERKKATSKLKGLYKKNGWAVPESLKEAMSYDDLEEKIRDAIDPPDANGDRSYRYWIRETFPGYCIVRDSTDSKYYRVEYTVDADDNVTIGQWQEGDYAFQVSQNPTGAGGPPAIGAYLAEGGEQRRCLESAAASDDVSGMTQLTEAATEVSGGKFRMTVIRPGWNTTLDGKFGDKYYTRSACAALVPLLENAQAYADHSTQREEADRPERSVRELVGHWESAKQEQDGSTTATFVLLESAAWLRPLLVEAIASPKRNFVGPSINGFGPTRIGDAEGRRGKLVESVAVLSSADIVTKPGAGGTVDRLLESQKQNKEVPELDWKDITIETLKANRPDLLETAGQERLKEAQTAFKADFDTLKESVEKVSAENKTLTAQLAAERLGVQKKTRIEELLKESKLPAIAQGRVTRLLESRDFTKEGALDEATLKEAVAAAVTEEKDYLTKLTEAGRITGNGFTAPSEGLDKQVEAMEGKFDKMFGVEKKPEGK